MGVLTGNDLLEIVLKAHSNRINGKILRKLVSLAQWQIIGLEEVKDILDNIPFLSGEDALTILSLYENYWEESVRYGAIIREIRESKNELLNEVLDYRDIEEIKFMLEIRSIFPVFKKDISAVQILLNSVRFIDNRKALFELIRHPDIYYKNSVVEMIAEALEYNGLQYATVLSYFLRNKSIRKNQACMHFILNEYDAKILRIAQKALVKNRVRKDIDALQHLASLKYNADKVAYIESLLRKYPDETDEERENKRKEEKRINDLTEDLAILIDDYVRRKVSWDEFVAALNNPEYQEIGVRRAYVPRSLRSEYGYGRR